MHFLGVKVLNTWAPPAASMFAMLNPQWSVGGGGDVSKCTKYTPAIYLLAVPFVLFIGRSIRWPLYRLNKHLDDAL